MKQQMKITKHAPVAEYRQIRKYVVDTVWESGNAPKRLASMRELAAMFNVSIATVQRALKELVDDGYLTVRAGVGLFTNPEQRWTYEKTDVIGILVADGRQIYYEKYMWELLAAIGSEVTGARRLLYPVNFLQTGTCVPETPTGIAMKGLIWLRPDFSPSSTADAFAASLKVPVVVVNSRRPGYSCICDDWEREGYDIGRMLLAEKRTAPVVVTPNDQAPQLAGLRRAFDAAGLALDERLFVRHGPDMCDRFRELLGRSGTPQAVYAIGSMVRDIQTVIVERNLDPEACRLIGEPVIREPYFRGWRIKHDFKALARTAWEQLAAEINGAPKRERNIVREIETIQ